MARINTQRTRKERTCGKCGGEIHIGDTYRYHKPRYGVKKTRCMRHECRYRPSELTGSDKLSTLYGIQEAIEDAIADGNLEGVRDELQAGAEQARETAEEYRASGQNIEDGFGHETEQSQELTSNGDEVETWGDRLEEAGSTVSEAVDAVETFEEDQATLQAELEDLQAKDEANEADEDGSRAARESAITDEVATIEEHIESATSDATNEAEEAANELSL